MTTRSRMPSSVPIAAGTPAATRLAAGAPQSLRDAAYHLIKHKIITCTLRPGDYLNEALVSNMIGVGRTPVRQAIDRLAQDGFLEIIPRKGMIVKPLGLHEIVQIIEVRRINEALCARLAAERARADDLAAMEVVLHEADRAANARDIERMMFLDSEFHFLLAASSYNPLLADMLRNLHERSLRFWFVSLTTSDHYRDVHEEHDEILAALRERDADKAEAAIIRHIDSFNDTIIRSLEQIGRHI